MTFDFYVRLIKKQFAPRTATVDGRNIKACQYCMSGFKTTNPVNPKYPIYKCEEKDMRLILDPRHVPRWCPNVDK